MLVQEIFGLDRFMQADAARWASLGFEVLAPSLFDRQEPGFVADHDADGLQHGFRLAQGAGLDTPVQDVETCVDALVARGPAFVVGYCYGGSVAWLAACRIGDLAAASAYYGGLIPNHAQDRPLCPVVLHYGLLDAHIPQDRVDLIRRHHPGLPVHVYETGGHGFNNEGGAAYDRPSAELARERTLALFAANGAG